MSSGMNQERIMQVLLAPHITEKTSLVAEQGNQVVFKVLPSATKPEIKQAVETLFKVKVRKVATANMKGKTKRFGGRAGQRSDWKKAYVTLAEGQELDFLNAE